MENNKYKSFCGGSILNKEWILSAAHCTELNLPMDRMVIKVGSNNVSSGGSMHKVEKIINHPNYDPRKKNFDISLVKLKDSLTFDENVAAIALPQANTGGNATCVVSGWGFTDVNGRKTTDKLQVVTVTTLTNQQCKESKLSRYQEFVPITDNQICTYVKPGVGFCQGDSGGPLTCDDVLVGLVSYNFPCARGYPDVYTRVYPFLDWIKENMQ